MTDQCKVYFEFQQLLAIFNLKKYFQLIFFKSFYFLLILSFFLPINSPAQKNNKLTNDQLELANLPIPIQQGITKSINQTTQNEVEVSLSNPAFKVHFTNKGLAFSPSQNDLTWTWQLDNINGQAGQPVHPILKENPTQKYVDYNRGNFTERYVFHNSSIEQVFIVKQRPVSGEICIEGSIETMGSFEQQKEGWSWNNGDGGINLGALYVYDATGKEIPASFDVYSNNTAIYIDEVALDKAQFPLTIDPEIGTNDFRISDMAPNGHPSLNIVDPVVAYNSTDNNYLVVWVGEDITGTLANREYEIFGQLITATGAKSGTVFRISNMGPDGSGRFRADDPAIAYNSKDNNYLVVWHGDDHKGGLVTSEFEIFGQLITAAGAESGTDFRISDMGGTGDAFYRAKDPAIAYNSTDNNYLVVWYGQDNTGALVYNEDEIFGQIITAAGTESGTDFRISDMGPDGTYQYEARFPEVAYNSTDNNYLVVWFGDDNTGTLVDEDVEVFGQIITAAGTESGADFRISNMGPDGSTGYDVAFPNVAYNSTDNNYLVVWYGPDNTGNLMYDEFEIFGQLITATGVKSGAYFRISDMGLDGDGSYDAYDPSVVYNLADNNYLVSWLGDDNTGPLVEAEYEIFGQVITATGAESGTDFRISNMGPDGDIDYDAYNPWMAYNSVDNNYLVVWTGDDNTPPLEEGAYEIFGQLYTTNNCDANVIVSERCTCDTYPDLVALDVPPSVDTFKTHGHIETSMSSSGDLDHTLIAGESITLLPGFFANNGSQFTSFIQACNTGCNYTDSLVLVALYNATNGTNWTNTWNLSQPVNTWYGVDQNSEGCVIKVYLEENNLIGTIPPELGNLTSLEEISLKRNQLSGSIPSEIGNLLNLEYIHLASNDLTGSISPELGNLTNLEYLSLEANELTGIIPTELGNLVNLRSLFLSFNQLTGSIPSELGNLVQIRNFFLFANQLTGSIPSELGNLVNVYSFHLFNNQLTGSIPSELGNLTNVNFFYLHDNQLSGSIPPELGNLTNSNINLKGNQLSGCFPNELMALCTAPTKNFTDNLDLPGGGDFDAFCNNGTGKCTSLTDDIEATAFKAATLGEHLNKTVALQLSVIPNPVKQEALINFILPNPTRLKLVLYDLQGRAVETVEDRQLESAGNHQVRLFVENYPSGLYYIHLETDKALAIKKVVVID